MDLEFHQLELRYERLRIRQPARERRLLASLADTGQQTPIVVVTAGATYVVVDGHKRVRCLRRLQRDTVTAVVWEMPEADALIFRHLLHTDAPDSAFEQGWLLCTLHEQHDLALDALARRFDRSVSWVSRRLSLVRTLPDQIFAPCGHRPRYVHDGAQRLREHLAQFPEHVGRSVAPTDLIVRSEHAKMATAEQWAVVQDLQSRLPTGNVVLRTHRVSFKQDARVPAIVCWGVLVTIKHGPFTLRREYAVADSSNVVTAVV